MLTQAVRYASLRDAPVVISGGASGIGKALVQSFARQGARVGFVDRIDDPGHELAKALCDEGHHARFRPCDITDTTRYRDILAELADVNGPCQILVNNAANDQRHAIGDVTPEAFAASLAVNLGHTYFACQAVIPGMMDAGSGSIINFGSISWMHKTRQVTMYAAAKAGLHGLTRALATDFGSWGIRVNTIVPGWVMTPKQRELHVDAEAERHIDAMQMLPGRLMPDDIAAMTLFLASDQSRMCTGQNFIVDAGWV